MKSLGFLLLLSVLVGCHGGCVGPQVEQQTYSTSDRYMASETVFIIEVELKCQRGEPPSLHAVVNNQLLPVAKGIGANKYQLSWTEPHESTTTGRRTINFYDEEGASNIRKALRYNEEMSADVLFSVNMDHKAVKTGGWLAPSFIAVIVSLLVWWLAHTTKGKLQE